ncbi:hypothetical protein BKA66DRAFT_573072 [Pyrenochaeta sp. MPI-SDFR-AT-0127]|nr:hypothetical protein BKA66DRAFT_573072 [Pyrenochaeta sp. MPI-SDFR-AT-0127]
MSESEPHAPAPAGLSKKRSRTVSNLTEKQIRHKREVDRRAQRAFRQRTKDCFAKLEQEHLQLQETSRETEAQLRQELQSLQEQNQSLLRCLDHIIDLATIATTEKPGETVASVGAEIHIGNSQCPASRQTSYASQLEEPHLRLPSVQKEDLPGVQPSSSSLSSRDALVSPGPEVEDRLERCQIPANAQDGFQNATAPVRSSTVSSDVFVNLELAETNRSLFDSYPVHGSDARESFYPELTEPDPPSRIQAQDESLENFRPHGTTVEGMHTTPVDQGLAILSPRSAATTGAQPYNHSRTICTVLPLHLLPTCPLDEILLDFLGSHREMLSKGMPLDVVVGPEKPTAKAFINPELFTSVHGISKVLSEILSTFPHVPQTEKLAFFYVMHKTMRWQISTTREDYAAMPAWLRPTVTQIAVPHAAWIDNIPWPGVRDILIENPSEYPFEPFSKYYSQNVTVNWQFDGLDTIADISGEAVLHSIFEKHIRNIHNWTVASEFHSRFPDMTSAIYSRDSPKLQC